MINPSFENETFSGSNFSETGLKKGEYENCIFRNCNLSSLDLNGNIFFQCQFISCDLSMVQLKNASFREVDFINCKQLGLRFDECHKMLLSFKFEGCTLNFSSFYKLKLKGIVFRNCQLQDVDFTESDLTKSVIDNCDLQNAVFEKTVLEGSDFVTAYNFSIDPEINRMKKARFSNQNLSGLLSKHNLIIE